MSNGAPSKRHAAEAACKHVRSGMVLGLGTGSTSRLAVDIIGAAWRVGSLRDIVAIATSEETARQARDYGIPLHTLEQHAHIDLAIDGADEVDPRFNLIKGLGGALLREKAVELRARRFIVIVDDSKLVQKLGTRAPLPVEVEPGRESALRRTLTELGCEPSVRGGATPFITDNGNTIIDCRFAAGIDDPSALAKRLDATLGVRAHGLFLDMATDVIVGDEHGARVLQR